MTSLNELNFDPITEEHIKLLKSAFGKQKYRTCGYTVGSALMWRKIYDLKVCESDGTVILSAYYSGEGNCYSIPIGENVKELLCAVYSRCRKQGQMCVFSDVPEDGLRLLENVFREQRMRIVEDDGWNDYLYNASDLSTYPGKKFNGQRNHINKFNRLYPDAVFEPITEKNFCDAYDFLQGHIMQNGDNSDSGKLEGSAALELMRHYFSLELCGAVLKVDGKIIAISVGEIMGDTLFVHIEKANTEFSGVYQVTVQRFAEMYAKDLIYINREEDDGVEGLRKSKLSYHPVSLLKKYSVEIK